MARGFAPLREYRGLFERRVWLLTYGQVLLSLGRGMLMPFSALYFYNVQGFPLTIVGLAFAIAFPAGAIVGLFGGALADRIGRKPLMVAGFAINVVSTVALAFVTTIPLYLATFVVNAIGFSAWGPASRAMIADVTPADRRTRAYGLSYMANNLGLSVGLLVGGLLALFLDYRALFFAEAAGAAAYLVVVIVFVRESHARGERVPGRGATVTRTLAEIAVPFRHRAFLLFAVVMVLAGFGWAQFYSTYSPYFKNVLHFSDAWIGALYAINTLMVVGLQVPLAGWAEKRARTRVYIVATYALAWSLVLTWAAARVPGAAVSLGVMALAIVVMTVGEILAAPVGSALVAGMAGGSANFGKYMAAFDLTWAVSGGVGAVLGGAFFDAGRPMLLWPVVTALVTLSLGGYVLLGRILPRGVNDPNRAGGAREAPPSEHAMGAPE